MSSWTSTRSPSGSISASTSRTLLDRCDILVAIVGPRWATPDESGKLRLTDETDWVRIEIEAALAKRIPVIPVLIDGTTLPAPADLPEGLRNLAFRQAAPVDSARDFHPHMDRLIKAMDRLLGTLQARRPRRRKRRKSDASRKQTTRPRHPAATRRRYRCRTRRDESAGKKKDPGATGTATTLGPDVEPKGKSSRASLSQVGRLLFSTQGRISRAPFWVVVVVTYPLMMAAALALALLYEALSATPLHDMPAISFLAVFLWLWIIAAVGIKRLHDRDRPGYLIALPIILGAIVAVVIAAANKSAAAILPAAGFVALFALVPLGFVKGTPGPNRYGPDPLAAKAPTPLLTPRSDPASALHNRYPLSQSGRSALQETRPAERAAIKGGGTMNLDFQYLFTSFEGRINRAKYWAGTIILAVISIVLGFVIGAIFGASTFGAILIVLVTLALFYPGYAVAAKRFQDRDKPGITAFYGLVPVLIASLLQAFGLTGTPQEPNALGWICTLVTMGVGLWFLIELGILKGLRLRGDHSQRLMAPRWQSIY